MEISEAVGHLSLGKMIRRKSWAEGRVVVALAGKEGFWVAEDVVTSVKSSWYFAHGDDLLADDWEVELTQDRVVEKIAVCYRIPPRIEGTAASDWRRK